MSTLWISQKWKGRKFTLQERFHRHGNALLLFFVQSKLFYLVYKQNQDLFECFAGGVGSGSRTNDLFFLELNSMTWSQASFVGTAPSPRQSSALCIVQSTQLLLHGGQNHFVLDDLFVYDILVIFLHPSFDNGRSSQKLGRCYTHKVRFRLHVEDIKYSSSMEASSSLEASMNWVLLLYRSIDSISIRIFL